MDFDRKWAALASGRAPPETPQETASIEIERNKMSTAAALVFHVLQVVYEPGLLTHCSKSMALDAKPFLDNGTLPPGITVGMRMPSHAVRYHASAFVGHLGDTLKSNGRFKIMQVADLHLSTGLGACRDPYPDGYNGGPCEADPRTLDFVAKMLDDEKPDMVGVGHVRSWDVHDFREIA